LATSSSTFTSVSRHKHESFLFLGFEPRSLRLRRFWASEGRRGLNYEKRFRLELGSDEYAAVEGIFKVEPTCEGFYTSKT
jgi:hypothetical protein